MKNVTILRVAMPLAVVALVFAAPALAQVGFTDDFESYTSGTTLGAPWCDWGTGVPPAFNTNVNATGGVGNSQCVTMPSGEPVRWFTNPLDAQRRYVDVEFSYCGTAGAKFMMFAGGTDATPGTPGVSMYYNSVGPININDSSSWYYHGTPGRVTYSTSTDTPSAYEQSLPFNFDDGTGTIWNHIRLRLMRLSATVVRGQGQLWVNGVSSNQWDTGWDLESGSAPSSAGLNFVDIYSAWGGGTADPCIDNFNVVQGGFAIQGDANHDVTVNDSDLNLLLTGWSTGATPGTTWQEGDFNDDVLVNDSDLNLLLTNWSYPASGGSLVPEPATIGLLAFGAIALVRRRRRA